MATIGRLTVASSNGWAATSGPRHAIFARHANGSSLASMTLSGSADTGASSSGLRVGKHAVRPFCAICQRDLPRHHHHPDSAAAGCGDSSTLECHACHRCFHRRCHSHLAAADPAVHSTTAPPPPAPPEEAHSEYHVAGHHATWFHHPTCQKVHAALQAACRAGAWACFSCEEDAAQASTEQALLHGSKRNLHKGNGGRSASGPGSGGDALLIGSRGIGASGSNGNGDVGEDEEGVKRTFRLMDCRHSGSSALLGMRQAHRVLRGSFGYSLRDMRMFDYVALLQQASSPVCAGVLDVYGSECAELFVVATAPQHQRQGHCRALIHELSATLAGAGVQRLLVSVDDTDAHNRELWQARFGFSPLRESDLAGLARCFSGFRSEARHGAVFLGLRLLPHVSGSGGSNLSASQQ